MKKKIVIAIANFAIPTPRKGSIDVYSGFGPGQKFGIEIHHETQRERAKNHYCYEAEVWTSHKFYSDHYIFEVNGKMDGVYHEAPFRIEEIKTAFDLNKLFAFIKSNEDHPYSLQLKTYGYIHWLKTKEIPDLNLHLVSSRNRKSIDHKIDLHIENYELWLSRRLKELVAEVKLTEKIKKNRKKLAKSIVFPFAMTRSGQQDLIESVDNVMQKNKPLLIQAPTGLGKTIGILFPALSESLQRGQKVIYLTPKNSQHIVAMDAVKNLQAKGSKIKSLVLTAKRKICMKQEPMCNPDYCEFAENHYTKVAEFNLIKKLQKAKRLTSSFFKKIAEEYKVCPYELQMDMISHVETVVCDYNYVFSPQATTSRVGELRIGEEEKPNVIIDEFHNLPARAMDYYSPGLSVVYFEKISRMLESIPLEFQEKFLKLLKECIAIIQACESPGKYGPQLFIPSVKLFIDHENILRDFLAAYLEADITINPNDIVLNVFNYWSDFTAALEWATLGEDEFFTTYYPNPPAIKITCCDASAMLKTCYEQFAHIVGFSATLKPFDYYIQLTGLNLKKLETKEFYSPFPKERRKLIIIPQVSSRYSDRFRNYPRIADVIFKISALKKGNYFAFFPSFDFMEKVYKIFSALQFNFKLVNQKPGMRQEEVRAVLSALSQADSAHIIFAVQGGVFSEGIDYPGDLAIGAFIVGTPLPTFDWERQKMKEYYQSKYGKGEEYALIYPAMSKAIQAAGRVIRSETDKGIIILMDDRFLQPSYYQCMPQDWFENEPGEIVSKSILDDITRFWNDTDKIEEVS